MTQTQSRRNFLRNVGLAGGAGVMLHSMGALGLTSAHAAETPSFTPPKPSDLARAGSKSVVILGGGIAGLTAAYELLKGGYKVTVLEGRERPGGRNFTVRGGTRVTDLKGVTQVAGFSKGQYMNAGPGRLPQSHITLDYCKELGVPIEAFTNQNANALLYYPGDHGIGAVQMRQAKADTYGYVSELLAKATDKGALDEELTAADKEALIAFLRNFGDLGSKAEGYAYTGSSRAGYTVEPGAGQESGTEVAPNSMSAVLAAGLGQYFSFEFGYDQAMMMYQPVGGMDAIPNAFAKAVGARNIRYGAEVVEWTNTSTGVSVAYKARGRTETIEADFAINCMPPNIAAKVPHNLGADITASLKSFGPSNAGKIGIEYDRRWWEEDFRIYGGITNTRLDLRNMWHPSYGFNGDRGTMIGYYNTGSAADTYGALSPAQRLSRAVDMGKQIFGDVYGEGITASYSQDWKSQKFSEGAWAYSTTADTDPLYTRLLDATGNTYFAGDHLSHSVAWQHGAITAARAAVEKLHARVTA